MKVTYHPSDGPPVIVSGVFSDPYTLVQGAEQAGVEAIAPTLFVRLEDLPVDPEIDDPIITVNGTTYRVSERRVAGLGSIVLALRRLP